MTLDQARSFVAEFLKGKTENDFAVMAEQIARKLVSAERMAIFKAISELDLERTKYMSTGIGGLALEKFRKRLIELRDSTGVIAKEEEIDRWIKTLREGCIITSDVEESTRQVAAMLADLTA